MAYLPQTYIRKSKKPIRPRKIGEAVEAYWDRASSSLSTTADQVNKDIVASFINELDAEWKRKLDRNCYSLFAVGNVESNDTLATMKASQEARCAKLKDTLSLVMWKHRKVDTHISKLNAITSPPLVSLSALPVQSVPSLDTPNHVLETLEQKILFLDKDIVTLRARANIQVTAIKHLRQMIAREGYGVSRPLAVRASPLQGLKHAFQHNEDLNTELRQLSEQHNLVNVLQNVKETNVKLEQRMRSTATKGVRTQLRGLETATQRAKESLQALTEEKEQVTGDLSRLQRHVGASSYTRIVNCLNPAWRVSLAELAGSVVPGRTRRIRGSACADEVAESQNHEIVADEEHIQASKGRLKAKRGELKVLNSELEKANRVLVQVCSAFTSIM